MDHSPASPPLFYDSHGTPTPLPAGQEPKSFYTCHAVCLSQGNVLLSYLPQAGEPAEFPGGRRDEGEDMQQGFRREFREETGLILPANLTDSLLATHTQKANFHARLIGKFFHLDQTYLLLRWPDSLADHGPDRLAFWIGPEDQNRMTWTPVDHLLNGSVPLRHEHGRAFEGLRHNPLFTAETRLRPAPSQGGNVTAPQFGL